jgi:hypothetical protein
MDEKEFIRRMRNKGVKLNDQQLKGAYRQYVKDPEPFRDLVGESVKDPFLRGLEGTAETAKVGTIPGAKPTFAKLPYIRDNAIEAKAKPLVSSVQGGLPASSSVYDSFMKSFGNAMGLGAGDLNPALSGIYGIYASPQGSGQNNKQDYKLNAGAGNLGVDYKPSVTSQGNVRFMNSFLTGLGNNPEDEDASAETTDKETQTNSPTQTPSPTAGATDPNIEPQPQGGSVQSERDRYEDEKFHIENDKKLSEVEKAAKLNELDKRYGKNWYDNSNIDMNDTNAVKLKQKTDAINSLIDELQVMRDRNDPTGEIEAVEAEIDKLKKELSVNDRSYTGDYVDPTKIVDIQLNNKGIGNARFSKGGVSGNLNDIVAGLGGKVNWDRAGTSASIYDADGKLISTIKRMGEQAFVTDANGKTTKELSVTDGQVQTDAAAMADALGVPYSYYHDKNGKYHFYTQPEMRGAPVRVVRKENEVYIDVYVDFRISGLEPTTADLAEVEKVYAAIDSTWNTGKEYELCGMNSTGDSDKVKLHTTINANLPKGKYYGNGVPKGQQCVTINLDRSENDERKLFNGCSHVRTVDFDKINPFEIGLNGGEALLTGQYEKALNNWTMEKPGEMILYNPDDAAHEFGHLLGLGDAYAAFYRNNKAAGQAFKMLNEYGNMATYLVPKQIKDSQGNTLKHGDIMRSGDEVTDTNIALLVNYVWRKSEPYYYNKDEGAEDGGSNGGGSW